MKWTVVVIMLMVGLAYVHARPSKILESVFVDGKNIANAPDKFETKQGNVVSVNHVSDRLTDIRSQSTKTDAEVNVQIYTGDGKKGHFFIRPNGDVQERPNSTT